MTIFSPQNLTEPNGSASVEPDLAMEEVRAKIASMTTEELFPSPEKTEDEKQLELILQHFPGSRVFSPPEPPKENLNNLLDQTPAIPVEAVPTQVATTDNAILNEALRLRRDGISVIPVGINKRPLLPWQEFQSRIASEEEVTRWFTQWPTAQLAMVTGSISNICVVDVEKEFGDYKTLALPETSVVKTGSGGWHLYYRYVPGVRNRAKIGGKDLDIRAEGGYVLVAPSRNEKGQYEWLSRVETLPPFPVQAFGPETIKREKSFDKDEHTFVDMDYAGADEGGRNDSMTRYIGALLTQVHPNSWEKIAWAMAKIANTKNEPPLPEDELRKTFESVCKREMETEQKRFWEYQQERKEVLKEKEVKEAQLLDEIEIVHIEDAAESRRALSACTRYSTGFAIFDNAMKGGFKGGDYVVVTGISGQGKTSLAQTFTYSLSVAGVSSLWFSWETTIDVLDEKFRNMGLGREGRGKSYNVYVPSVTPSGSIAFLKVKIQEASAKFGVKAVFVDMVDYVAPSGIKNSDNETIILKRAANELKALAVELGIIIFAMAHVRKLPKGQDRPTLMDIQASAGIFQFADHVFAISRLAEKKKTGFGGSTEKVYTNQSVIEILKNRETGEQPNQVCLHQNDLFYPAIITPQAPIQQSHGQRD